RRPEEATTEDQQGRPRLQRMWPDGCESRGYPQAHKHAGAVPAEGEHKPTNTWPATLAEAVSPKAEHQPFPPQHALNITSATTMQLTSVQGSTGALLCWG